MRNILKSILGILGTHLYDLSAIFEIFGRYILLDHSKFLEGLEKVGVLWSHCYLLGTFKR